MNRELWDKIVQFEFDNPPDEYCFSIRLADENFWTKDFTEKAILEYKKFMFLAATSDFMVSPSEIVDIVWHQHLIFTQSYHQFCKLIGKQIQHVPSTHNKEDFKKFKLAKERTIQAYESNFGKQPKALWEFSGMYESLNLDKAKIKLRTFIIIGILAFLVLIVPFYFILKPLYIQIDNPDFILGFLVLMVVFFIGLEYYNKAKFKQFTELFDKDSFIYQLQPLELVYLKTQKLSDVINGPVNELVRNNCINIKADYSLEIGEAYRDNSKEQIQTITVLKQLGNPHYSTLLKHLVTKPIFRNNSNCMDAFTKYFNKSKRFGNLFYLNFGVLSLLLMVGLIRLGTGILRDKPVLLIAIVVIGLIGLIAFFLYRLTNLLFKNSILDIYQMEILPSRKDEQNWELNYLLLGSSVFTAGFLPLAEHIERHNKSGIHCGSNCGSSGDSWSWGDFSSDSSDSGCSSCGSSCGGCGD